MTQALDRWAREAPGFDRPMADVVYQTVMKMDDDAALMLTRIIADATLQDDLLVHGQAISKAVNAQLVARAGVLRAQLARTAIAKARAGHSADTELAALSELSKNFVGDLFDRAHRADRARTQMRDLSSGQFVRQTSDVVQAPVPPVSEHVEGRNKIPAPPEEWGELTPEQRSAYQQAYHQVSALIRPYRRLPSGTAFVHLIDSNGQGMKRIVPINGSAPLEAKQFDPREDRKIVQAKISVLPPADEKGAYFSVFDLLGMPGTGAVAAGATSDKGVLDPEGLAQFKTNLTPQASDEHAPGQRVLRRLTASSQLLSNTLGDAAPPHAQMAFAVAQHVGRIGPPVRDIVGPTLDRAAYRYRGTERKLDPNLTAAMEADTREASSRSGLSVEAGRDLADAELQRDQRLRRNASAHAEKGAAIRRRWEQAGMDHKAGVLTRGQLKIQARRAQKELGELDEARSAGDKIANAEYAAAADRYGAQVSAAGQNKEAMAAHIMSHGYKGDDRRWKSGQVLGYFKTLVPNEELNRMHLEAGTVPPSQGVILDDKGQVTSQAVGYADDHYLPFTLRALRKLRGGSYIRTRSWGGPTAEDIRTALIGGARNLTVVSNNGVFTIDFDPTFRGGRRHNDKAHRMIGRYEHLLDVLKKENVARSDLDPTTLDELRAQAAKTVRDPAMTSQAFTTEFGRLKADYVKHPTLSTAQKDEVAREYLRGLATETGFADTDALIDDVAKRKARTKQVEVKASYDKWNREHPGEPMAMPTPASLEVATQEQRVALVRSDPQEQAAVLAHEFGRKDEFAAALQSAERENVSRVQNLRLDGPGYEAAMFALKEQFPYYIANTNFQRWDNQAQRVDTGYVRPGANRPGSAIAGFHDSGRVGGGRVRADSVRGQRASTGASVSQGNEAPAPAPNVSVAAAAPVTPEARAAVQARVDRDMLVALLRQRSFGPDAFVIVEGQNGQMQEQRSLKDGDIRLTAAEMRAANAPFPSALTPFYGPGVEEDALHDELARDPGAMHAKLLRAVTWMEEHNAFPVDADHAAAVHAFKTGGRAAEVADVNDTGELLARPNREYAFAHELGDEYVPGAGANTEAIHRAYLTDQLVAPLVNSDRLPPSLDDPDEFAAKSNALLAQLGQQDRILTTWRAGPRLTPMPIDEADHEARVRGLIAALTLQRRYTEAARVEDAQAAAERAERQAAFEAEQGRAAPIIEMRLDNYSPAQKQRLIDDPDWAEEQAQNMRDAGNHADASVFLQAIAAEREFRAQRGIEAADPFAADQLAARDAREVEMARQLREQNAGR